MSATVIRSKIQKLMRNTVPPYLLRPLRYIPCLVLKLDDIDDAHGRHFRRLTSHPRVARDLPSSLLILFIKSPASGVKKKQSLNAVSLHHLTRI